MVRSSRIKEAGFVITSPGSNVAMTPVFTDSPVNGEILKVQFETNDDVVVPVLTVSGTGETLWTKTGGTSGAGIQIAYPFVYPVDSTDTTGSPQAFTTRVAQGTELALAGGEFEGGSMTSFRVFYR